MTRERPANTHQVWGCDWEVPNLYMKLLFIMSRCSRLTYCIQVRFGGLDPVDLARAHLLSSDVTRNRQDRSSFRTWLFRFLVESC